jgi:hypothetical protein
MIEPDRPDIKVQSVGGVSPRIYAAIGLVAALFVLAILKPWDSPIRALPTPAETSGLAENQVPVNTPVSTASATPAVSDALAAAQRRKLCGFEPQWLLLTMETGSLGTSRTVYNVAPAPAAGPTDNTIPTIDLTAKQLLGIGVCRPGQLDQADGLIPVTGVTIWQISALGSPSIDPGVIIDADLSRVGEAYFRPAPTAVPNEAGSEPDWAPGRYAIEIAPAGNDGKSLWLALDFINIGATSASVSGQ